MFTATNIKTAAVVTVLVLIAQSLTAKEADWMRGVATLGAAFGGLVVASKF